MLLGRGEGANEGFVSRGETRRKSFNNLYQAHKARWIVAAALVAVLGGGYAGFEYTLWAVDERPTLKTDAVAGRKAAEKQAPREGEAKRPEAATARKKAEEETAAQAQTEAEAKRRTEEEARRRVAAEEAR
jgi:hypothetical protein